MCRNQEGRMMTWLLQVCKGTGPTDTIHIEVKTKVVMMKADQGTNTSHIKVPTVGMQVTGKKEEVTRRKITIGEINGRFLYLTIHLFALIMVIT